MLPELFNMTTGPAALLKIWQTTPDFQLYHDDQAHFTTDPTLPPLYEEKEKTGGPLGATLEYMSEKVKSEDQAPGDNNNAA